MKDRVSSKSILQQDGVTTWKQAVLLQEYYTGAPPPNPATNVTKSDIGQQRYLQPVYKQPLDVLPPKAKSLIRGSSKQVQFNKNGFYQASYSNGEFIEKNDNKQHIMPVFITREYQALDTATKDALFFTGVVAELSVSMDYIDLDVDRLYDQAAMSVFAMVDGQYVLGMWYKVSIDKLAFYAFLKNVTMHTKKVGALAGALIVGNDRVYGRDSIDHDWYAYFDRPLESSIPYTRVHIERHQFKLSKITQYHHTLMRPEEVLISYWKDCGVERYGIENKIKSVTAKGYDERLLAINVLLANAKRLGLDYEPSIATFMLYMITTKLYALRLLVSIIASAKSNEQFREQLKFEGMWSKQLQHYIRSDLNYLFELHVLSNRQAYEVDWDKEIKNRTSSDRLVDIDPQYVYEKALEMFSQAKNQMKKPKKMDWDEYWAERWARLPTGSYVSQYPDDMLRKKAIPGHNNANKTTVLCSIKDMKFEDLLEKRKPEIYASASTKYEWDKVRAVYGCDITSFLMADFSMGYCEECLPDYFPVGKGASQEKVAILMQRMNVGLPFCYDYDDFNSQHSFNSMKSVINAWLKVYESDLSIEQLNAGYWTAASVMNQRAKIPVNIDAVEIETVGGLFSGWRHTSFINTVLNRIYLMSVGLENNVIYSIHNGDDVFASLDNLGSGLELIEKAEKAGIKAQRTKMNIGTIAEFLRVDGNAIGTTGAQYLTRGCATAVHSRIESEVTMSLKSGLDATYDRMMSLKARGADPEVVDRAATLTVSNWCKQFKTTVDVAEAYYDLHPIQGGCNHNQKAIKNYRIDNIIIERDEGCAKDVVRMMDPGSQDYVNKLAKDFGVNVESVVRENIRTVNMTLVRGTKTTLRLIPETNSLIKVLKGVYKAHNDPETKIAASKVRMLGAFDIIIGAGAIGSMIEWIQKTPGSEKLLKYLM
jgi:hypothetical protein